MLPWGLLNDPIDPPPQLKLESPVSCQIRNHLRSEVEWQLEIECPLEQQKKPELTCPL